MKNNISKFDHCYGCGVCSLVCPTKIIDMHENDDGFYSPIINNQEKCIECGLCLDVCSFAHEEIANEPVNICSYAAYSQNELVRKSCSSGGVAYEIALHLLREGYKPCVVKYDTSDNRAKHYIADNETALEESKGSKYIQSYTIPGFKNVFRKNGKYLIVGTPCQIDSFRRYIRRFKIEDRFVLIDFFCHGVPSYLMWDKYLSDIKKITDEIVSVRFRDKTGGWHDSWTMEMKGNASQDAADPSKREPYKIEIRGKKTIYHKGRFDGDLFYEFFLGNYCLNECCYSNCKYKYTASSADIRVGDLWGHKYSDDSKGTSALLILTKKGREIVETLQSCSLTDENVSTVAEGQMKKCATKPVINSTVIRLLKTHLNLRTIDNLIIKPYKILILPKRIYRKIKRMI